MKNLYKISETTLAGFKAVYPHLSDSDVHVVFSHSYVEYGKPGHPMYETERRLMILTPDITLVTHSRIAELFEIEERTPLTVGDDGVLYTRRTRNIVNFDRLLK